MLILFGATAGRTGFCFAANSGVRKQNRNFEHLLSVAAAWWVRAALSVLSDTGQETTDFESPSDCQEPIALMAPSGCAENSSACMA